MEIWRPTEVGRSVPLLVVVIARVWRKRSITSDFPKTKRDVIDFRCLENLRCTILCAPSLFNMYMNGIKSTIPDLQNSYPLRSTRPPIKVSSFMNVYAFHARPPIKVSSSMNVYRYAFHMLTIVGLGSINSSVTRRGGVCDVFLRAITSYLVRSLN